MKKRKTRSRLSSPRPAVAAVRTPVNLEGMRHDCGGHFHGVNRTEDVVIGQRHAAVAQTIYRCDRCGEERQTLAELGRARREAAATIQHAEQILAPDDIRRIREERLGLTQAQLEIALGLGEKTVVRWETGRVLLSKATDALLRLIDRDPTALAFLAAHNGGDYEPPSTVHDHRPEDSPDTWAIPVPRRYRRALQALAASEGVDGPTLVVWIIADAIAGSATVGTRPQVAAMHQDLASRIDSLQQIWKAPQVALGKRTGAQLSYTATRPYAGSA